MHLKIVLKTDQDWKMFKHFRMEVNFYFIKRKEANKKPHKKRARERERKN